MWQLGDRAHLPRVQLRIITKGQRDAVLDSRCCPALIGLGRVERERRKQQRQEERSSNQRASVRRIDAPMRWNVSWNAAASFSGTIVR